MIKVFGHQSPDTDTACSAIIWAWHLNNHTPQKAEAFVLGKLNKETQFVLNKWGWTEPALLEKVTPDDEVIIVDTNNADELLEGINDAKINTVVDHHRLTGSLQTSAPIHFYIKPLASTASVIYDLLHEHHEAIPNEIAGLIISCILSDTLAFTSPTTTPHDKDIAEKLAKQIDLDLSQYTEELFSAKSDISELTDIGLVKLDSKKTDLGDKVVRISVIETARPEIVLARKDGLIQAIKEVIAQESDVFDVVLFVVDILKTEATVLTYNDFTKKLIADSFEVAVESDTEVLPGIVSRKKQIIPALLAE